MMSRKIEDTGTSRYTKQERSERERMREEDQKNAVNKECGKGREPEETYGEERRAPRGVSGRKGKVGEMSQRE